MGKLNIYVILMISSMFIDMQISGSHAGEVADAEGEAEAEALFKNMCSGNEKLAKIVYYVQDRLGGPNRTVYEVARASITADSPTSFGRVRAFDDLITAEPDPNSERVGRVQGQVTSSDFQVSALTMNVNIYFTAGKYNGSTISMLGRFQVEIERRELAIVGGTGFFRFARGYAVSTTHSYEEETDYAILRYAVYATYLSTPKKALQ